MTSDLHVETSPHSPSDVSIYASVRIFDPNKDVLLEMDRTSYLVKRAKGHRVLHVGCTDHPITRYRIASKNLLHASLTEEASSLVGIDNSLQGINILKENGFTNVRFMDAEEINLTERFDVIIAGDVLEHMSNPGKFLEKVGQLLNQNGTLVVGVPNAYSFNILKYLVNGYEPTHKDHTYYFSVKTLSELCSRYGLLPTKLIFTVQPEGEDGRSLMVLLRKMLVKLKKQLAPSFIMEFMPRDSVTTTTFFEWK